jgi:hypothetical protein
MLAALQDRAREPSVAVDIVFSWYLIRYLIQRDHPELNRLSAGDVELPKEHSPSGKYYFEAMQTIATFLQSILSIKVGAAKETTSRTIEESEREVALGKKNDKSNDPMTR